VLASKTLLVPPCCGAMPLHSMLVQRKQRAAVSLHHFPPCDVAYRTCFRYLTASYHLTPTHSNRVDPRSWKRPSAGHAHQSAPPRRSNIALYEVSLQALFLRSDLSWVADTMETLRRDQPLRSTLPCHSLHAEQAHRLLSPRARSPM